MLRQHSPVDKRESESISKFLSMAPTLESPFDEHSDVVHVTVSAIVVSDPGRDKVVLHLHKRLNIWLQPGGHIEKDESLVQAGVREAREETGLGVVPFAGDDSFIHVDVHPGPRGHTHLDLRVLLLAPETTLSPADGESESVAWFSWDEALAMADAGLRGGLLAAKQTLGLDA